MTATLPLFSDLPDAVAAEQPAAPHEGDAGQRHLYAAWRLSRAMRRFPAGSAEETRAGLAICHHLQALLRQASGAQPSGSRRSGPDLTCARRSNLHLSQQTAPV
jgi:hypothetical protein